jgi:hypothetical protein
MAIISSLDLSIDQLVNVGEFADARSDWQVSPGALPLARLLGVIYL